MSVIRAVVSLLLVVAVSGCERSQEARGGSAPPPRIASTPIKKPQPVQDLLSDDSSPAIDNATTVDVIQPAKASPSVRRAGPPPALNDSADVQGSIRERVGTGGAAAASQTAEQ